MAAVCKTLRLYWNIHRWFSAERSCWSISQSQKDWRLWLQDWCAAEGYILFGTWFCARLFGRFSLVLQAAREAFYSKAFQTLTLRSHSACANNPKRQKHLCFTVKNWLFGKVCMEGQCVGGGKHCYSSIMLVNLLFFKNFKCIHYRAFQGYPKWRKMMALFCFLWSHGIEFPFYILITSHTKCLMFLRLKPSKSSYLHTEKYVSIYDFFLLKHLSIVNTMIPHICVL